MFRFANPEYLHLLYIIPIMVLIYYYFYKKEKLFLEKFIGLQLHKHVIPERSTIKNHIKFGIYSFALVLVILTLANPQIGTRVEEVKQLGIDVYIALDVSLSMSAEDIKPNRLQKAKFDISKLIQKLEGDRIGLIIFSGRAYIQFPLTTDYGAANLFLNTVNTGSIPQPGTALAEAIDLASDSFKEDKVTEKVIIVISDGEDHEGDIEKAVEKAKDKNIKIYTIGIGSITGVPIPVYDERGNNLGFKKDLSGNTVLTKLDENTLKQVSKDTGGEYFKTQQNSDELNEIYNKLSNLEQSEYGTKKVTEYEDRYYYFLFPALLLLFIDAFISNRKSKLYQKLYKSNGEQ
ncbi:MAG: VWA domain-containing protein [Ignavibacteriaceae bacterium]|nr:VWA domain-containing protein [Ignavibacteriaceae bacterium]